MTTRLALRRILAFAIDWSVLLVYAGSWFGAMVLLFGIGWIEQQAEDYDAIRGQLTGFFTLTLPLAMYFAITESSPRQATIGKRVLDLRVTDPAGDRLRFGRALARAAVKLLPWEIAHVFTNHLWQHVQTTPDAPEPIWLWVVLAVSMGGALAYLVALFAGDGRTPYDRIAGTRVS